jgi:hypothetical protein
MTIIILLFILLSLIIYRIYSQNKSLDKRIFLTTEIIVLGKTPTQIFAFFFDLDKEKYIKWHKKDHIDYKIIKETSDIVGSVFYYDEDIGGKIRIKYNWELMEMETDKMLLMKAQFIIPIYLLLTCDKTGNGTLIKHQLQIGYKKNGFVNSIIKKLKFTDEIAQTIHQHAIEEFKNLEHLIN